MVRLEEKCSVRLMFLRSLKTSYPEVGRVAGGSGIDPSLGWRHSVDTASNSSASRPNSFHRIGSKDFQFKN